MAINSTILLVKENMTFALCMKSRPEKTAVKATDRNDKGYSIQEGHQLNVFNTRIRLMNLF
jgi:hypothetical protein